MMMRRSFLYPKERFNPDMPLFKACRFVNVLLLLSFMNLASAFMILRSGRLSTTGTMTATQTSRRTDLNMCICINCSRVTNCAAYHFVETKHEQPHMTSDPTFTPRDGSPTIHVNVRTVRPEQSNDAFDTMRQEHSQQTTQAMDENPDLLEGQLHGSKVYDVAPVTTYEYDVVACADYMEDVGCWVRNMPEEIRKSNPTFVPT